MEVASLEIPYRSRKDTFRIWFIGDIHLGSKLCDEKQLKNDIDAIRVDPNAKVFLLGDICDFISLNDWRYESDNIAPWVDPTDVGNSQMEYAVKLFDPIADKIIGAIQGNHERTMERDSNNNVHKNFCNDLSLRNLGYSALIRMAFTWRRNKTDKQGGDFRALDIFLHHGFGGGRTMGADGNRFAEVQRGYEADIYVMGHTHQRHASKSIIYKINNLCDELVPKTRLACRSGTYLKTTQQKTISYSERAGFNPLVTGGLCITYHPDRRELIANV